MCCRPESGPTPTDPLKAAPYWGSFNKCDIPLHTVDALLADAKQKHSDISMVVWTGDNTAHDIWNQSKTN
jgi:sphingomyelin phosphodiesterase